MSKRTMVRSKVLGQWLCRRVSIVSNALSSMMLSSCHALAVKAVESFSPFRTNPTWLPVAFSIDHLKKGKVYEGSPSSMLTQRQQWDLKGQMQRQARLSTPALIGQIHGGQLRPWHALRPVRIPFPLPLRRLRGSQAVHL